MKEWLQSFNLAKNKINYLIDNKCITINQEIVYKREHLLKENDEIIAVGEIGNKEFASEGLLINCLSAYE